MAYTTSDLNAIIAKLEASLGKGYAEVTHDGQKLVYRSAADIMRAIGYFKGLLSTATDAPVKPKVRTFLLYGGGR